jgi:hypothetical protein
MIGRVNRGAGMSPAPAPDHDHHTTQQDRSYTMRKPFKGVVRDHIQAMKVLGRHLAELVERRYAGAPRSPSAAARPDEDVYQDLLVLAVELTECCVHVAGGGPGALEEVEKQLVELTHSRRAARAHRAGRARQPAGGN